MQLTRNATHWFAALASGLMMTTIASGQILRPDADNRSGSTNAFVGGAGNPEPIDSGYNIDPSENYRVINLSFPVSDSGGGNSAAANLVTQSRWTDYTSNNGRFSAIVFDSNATANVARVSGTVRAASADNINMGFRIEGLPAGQSVAMHVVATITATGGGTGSIRLVNPSGTNVMNLTSGSVDQVFLLTANGEYSFRGANSISLQRSTNGSASGSARIVGSMTFEPAAILGPITNAANGHRYFMLQPSSWQAAQATAQRLNGNLVTINDAAENNWVFSNLAVPTGGRPLWLGLTDQTTEGQFRWISGETASFRQFAAGEPNNSGNEDYAQMRAGSATWNDTIQLSSELVYGIVEATACPCDWNNNGELNSQDLFDFLSAFFSGSADYNRSGETNSQDFFDYLACFFSNCG